MRFSDQNYNVYGAFINAPFSGISTTQCRSLQVARSVNRDPFDNSAVNGSTTEHHNYECYALVHVHVFIYEQQL